MQAEFIKYFVLMIVCCTSLEISGQAFLSSLTKEEKQQYRDLEKRAKTVPVNMLTSPYDLASYLTDPYDEELMKVRAIFVWISKNIKYDMRAFLTGDLSGQGIDHVLEKRLAICEGFSNLFSALCSQVGIENEKIIGYSKGYGYKVGHEFVVSNHAWNSVKIGTEWHLLDVSWSAESTGATNSKEYFLVEPNLFLKDHLPEDPTWQLIQEPISIEDFEKGVGLKSKKNKRQITPESDPLSKEIKRYERIVRHNPKNQSAIFRLGYAYLSKALDTLDIINSYPSDKEQLLEMEKLGKRYFSLIDKAMSQFKLVDEGKFDGLTSLKIECEYQKGVCHYELGYKLLSSLYDLSEEEFVSLSESFFPAVDRYWDSAIDYFKKIPASSLYFDGAQNYINHSIPSNRPDQVYITD